MKTLAPKAIDRCNAFCEKYCKYIYAVLSKVVFAVFFICNFSFIKWVLVIFAIAGLFSCILYTLYAYIDDATQRTKECK
jgi:ABC-type bacteriocin/lantibiotic exporter with double-glycine peptidase domain